MRAAGDVRIDGSLADEQDDRDADSGTAAADGYAARVQLELVGAVARLDVRLADRSDVRSADPRLRAGGARLVEDDDDETAGDGGGGAGGAAADRELEQLLRRERLNGDRAACVDDGVVVDRCRDGLIDDVDDDRDRDACALAAQGNGACHVDDMRVVLRGDLDRLAANGPPRVVDVDAGLDLGVGLQREDVDDDRAGHRRVAAAAGGPADGRRGDLRHEALEPGGARRKLRGERIE